MRNQKGLLENSNRAFREGDYVSAVKLLVNIILDQPGLAPIVLGNLDLAKNRFRAQRDRAGNTKVAVCGWDLAHNAAGRVYTLAKMYHNFAEVEIIGSIFSKFGQAVWPPLADISIPMHQFLVREDLSFVDQAARFVASRPYDIVHLSKPRFPNIIFGLLYKLMWNAKVIMDIDDEELAFVGEPVESIDVEDIAKENETIPNLSEIDENFWTRVAVGLAQEFDGVTVSNLPLQQRYGGEIVRHARDESEFVPSKELRDRAREKLGLLKGQKAVLFAGTPHEHKGLLEIARALSELERDDTVFIIVGEFPETSFKRLLQSVPGISLLFLGAHPIGRIHEMVAAGDVVILPQAPNALVSQFQTPAKLSDAFAMGVPVVVSDHTPMTEIVKDGAGFVVRNRDELNEALTSVLNQGDVYPPLDAPRRVFLQELSFAVNIPRLKRVALGAPSREGLSHKMGILLSSIDELAPFCNRLKTRVAKNLPRTSGHARPATDRISSLKILQVTPPKPRNPFYTMINDVLIKRGIEVQYEVEFEKILQIAQLNSNCVLHFHQLEPLYHSRANSEEEVAARAEVMLKFMRELKELSVRLVWTKHNPLPHNTAFAALDARVEKSVLELVDRVVLLSRGAASELEDYKNKLVSVLHPEFSSVYGRKWEKREARRVLDLPEDTFIFASIGELKPYKDHHNLIDAFENCQASFPHKDMRLLIIGNPGPKNYVESLMARSGDKVIIRPNDIPSEKMACWLSAVDISVFAFERIWVSGSVILSLSYGVPVVAPDVGYLDEYVSHGNTGFLYRRGDITNLSQAMAEAVTVPYRQHLEYMCDVFRTKCSITSSVDAYQNIFLEA